jgi:signal transduction histidine kinase
MKRLPIISVFCYALVFVVWIVDLFTPQLFVVAILLNGPVALSSLALNTRLTVTLIVLAEIANVIAGYVNGAQAHYHWDTIAVGDRVLTAASFLLVGYLTIRAQEYARSAGSAMERSRVAAGEKSLRRALDAVRATLNVELVLRAIVREALALVNANEALLIVRSSQLAIPTTYRAKRESSDVGVERNPLEPALASLVQRATNEARVTFALPDDPVARMLLDAHRSAAFVSVRLGRATPSVLIAFADGFSRGDDRLLQAFAEGGTVALEQAEIFMQLGYRNQEISVQKDVLEHRSRVIRDIVYALAHDLRTPLLAENLTMQQAFDGKYGELPEQYRQILRTTMASNADVRRLVETLLVVARFESGESSTLEERIDLSEQTIRVAEELKPIAEVKRIALETRLDAHPIVIGDASDVRRAISNLVANAIEATPESGHVELAVEQDGGNARLRVKDDGYGVTPEQRPRLFERFGSGNRPAGGGTGLGLYIVRLIAQKYHGSVEYAPREPKGSVFTLTLPVSEGNASA